MSASTPVCFVVCPIGSEGSPERKHSDLVFKFILRPVLSELGFAEPIRADTLSEPGNIGSQIIRYLLNADLVVADLTGRNPNVFYELAIRHCSGLPFVQLISRGEAIPFDVGHQRTIMYDRTDLADVEYCKAELRRQIETIRRPDFFVETPIGHALNLEKLSSSPTVEQTLALILADTARLRSDLYDLSNLNEALFTAVMSIPTARSETAHQPHHPDTQEDMPLHELTQSVSADEQAMLEGRRE